MAIKKETIGTGLTERSLVTMTNEGGPITDEELRRYFNRSPNPALAHAEAIEDTAKTQFSERGLPLPGPAFLYVDGKDQIVEKPTVEQLLTGERRTKAFTYIEYFERLFGIDSREWFQALILQTLMQTREVLEEQQGTRSPIDLAITLGVYLERFYWKFEHEEAALQGYKLASDRKRGQEIATTERVRAAKKRRDGVIRLARKLLAGPDGSDLSRNDSMLARKIAATECDSLRQENGQPIGFEAIRRRLREARIRGDLG